MRSSPYLPRLVLFITPWAKKKKKDRPREGSTGPNTYTTLKRPLCRLKNNWLPKKTRKYAKSPIQLRSQALNLMSG